MRRLITIALLLLACAGGRESFAAFQPWVCPAALSGVNTSGNLSTTTIFTPPATAWYDLKIAISPASTSTLATATVTLTFASDGSTRSLVLPSLSIASLTVMPSPAYEPLYFDAGTAVTIAISAPTGTYNWRVCWKPGT